MKLSELLKVYWAFVLIVTFVNTVFLLPIHFMMHTYNYEPTPKSPVKFLTINNTTIVIEPDYLIVYSTSVNNSSNISVLNISDVITLCNSGIMDNYLSSQSGEIMNEICTVANKMMQPPSSSILSLFGFWVPMFFSIAWKTLIMIATFPIYIFNTLYPIASINPIYVLALGMGCGLLGLIHLYSIIRLLLGKWLE